MRVGLLGCGYWGPNLLRNLVGLLGAGSVVVAEQSESRRGYVRSHFPEVDVLDSADALMASNLDALVVATPADTHYAFARRAIEDGVHVLVEKPLSLESGQARELVQLARNADLTLMAGHTFIYNPAVNVLKELLSRGHLGRPHYLYSQRLNLGQVRADVNVWWNLAPHDVSILLYLRDNQLPVEVLGQGFSYLRETIQDVAFATLRWEDGVVAHVHVSWLDPNKVRRMVIVGSQQMAVYDDISSDKIAIYDKGYDRAPAVGARIDYDPAIGGGLIKRWGDVDLPYVDPTEPLALEIQHFLSCIEGGHPPLTGGEHAVNTVLVLEAVQRSIDTGESVRLGAG